MDALYRVMDAVLPFECFRLSFMKNALLAMLLLTPLLALLGTMAVNRRMAFFSDALGHSALAGVGSDEIHFDQEELSSAVWVSRDELEPVRENLLSLTGTMIETFRLGKDQ